MTDYLPLISLILGFLGSIFLAKGILKLNTSSIIRISTTYWGRNPHHMDNLVTQKTDFIIGILLILLSFILQIITYIINELPNLEEYLKILIIICILLLILVLYLIFNSGLARIFNNFFRKDIARHDCEPVFNEIIKTNKITNENLIFLKRSSSYCKFKIEDTEPILEFLKRYSEYLGFELNFSSIDIQEIKI